MSEKWSSYHFIGRGAVNFIRDSNVAAIDSHRYATQIEILAAVAIDLVSSIVRSKRRISVGIFVAIVTIRVEPLIVFRIHITGGVLRRAIASGAVIRAALWLRIDMTEIVSGQMVRFTVRPIEFRCVGRFVRTLQRCTVLDWSWRQRSRFHFISQRRRCHCCGRCRHWVAVCIGQRWYELIHVHFRFGSFNCVYVWHNLIIASFGIGIKSVCLRIG